MFVGYLMVKSRPIKCICGHTNKRHTIKPEDKYPCDVKTCSCPDFEELRKLERKDFMKLRAELHDFIYSKKRNLDDLIYVWDFFREHMVVSDHIIKTRFLGKKKEKQKGNGNLP